MISFRAIRSLKLFILCAVLLFPFILTGCQDNARGETMQAKECIGKVRETPFGLKKLDCEGSCPEGMTCDWQSSKDGNGNERQWCGCSKTEPDTCHLVVKIPKDESASAVCDKSCPDGQYCKRNTKKQGDVTEVSCSCEKKASHMLKKAPPAKKK